MPVQDAIQDALLVQYNDGSDENFLKLQHSTYTAPATMIRSDRLATGYARHTQAQDAFVINCHLFVSLLSTFGIFDMVTTYFTEASTTSPLEVLTWISLFLFPTVAYYQARLSHGDTKQCWFVIAGMSISIMFSVSLSYLDSSDFVVTSLALLPVCTCGSLVFSTIYHEITAEYRPDWMSEKV